MHTHEYRVAKWRCDLDKVIGVSLWRSEVRSEVWCVGVVCRVWCVGVVCRVSRGLKREVARYEARGTKRGV